MLHVREQVAAAAAHVQNRWRCRPQIGIILGTGLGGLAEHVTVESAIDYAEIPHFPASTALSHRGRLICGTLAGVPVVTMEGRFHKYEGYSLQQITLPVRVMGALGINTLIISNASGGMNPNYASGDILIIEDHINLMFGNPLIGIHDEELGARFPDLSSPYDAALIGSAQAIADRENFTAHRGVYVGLTGPNYETRAEYRFLRRIGGDVVGMSTVPEVIVAAQLGLRVLALSVITNICLPNQLTSTSGEKVVAAAQAAEAHMLTLVAGVVAAERTNAK